MADTSEVIQNYLNSLNEAMAIHAKKAVEGLEFDRTELAEIVDITNRNYGEYQVFNGSTRYFAYSENTSYTLGTKVYVTIPNNDYSQQKTIVRKYSSKEGDTGVGYVMPLSQYDPLSKNIITDLVDKDNAYQNNEAGILANYDYEEFFINNEVNTDHKFPAEYSKLLYSARNLYLYQYISEEPEEEAESGDEPIPSGEGEPTDEPIVNDDPTGEVDDEPEVEEILEVKSNYQGYQYMGLSVEFKTLLPVETLISGKYGIEIAAGFVRNVEGTSAGIETQVKKYVLDSSDMIGSVYNFTTYYEQQALFKLPEEGWNLDALDIYLYQDGSFFERTGNALPITDGFGELLNDNILIRNLVIRFGNEKDTGAIDKIRLYTPNGATYDAAQTNEALNERTVRLLWTHRNPDTEAMEEMTRVSNIPNETDQRFKANIWWLRDSKHTWDEYRDELASAAEKQSKINRIAQNYLTNARDHPERINNDEMKELIYALGFKLNKEYTYTNGYFQITQDGVRVLERSITQNVDVEHPTVTSDWGAGWIPINETRDKFEVTFQPDIKNQTSSVRCVIEYGPWVENEDTGVEEINKDSQYYTVIYSDPLEFKNLSYIPDLTTWDASIGLTISATDKSNGHYPLYSAGKGSSLLNLADGDKKRELVADIASSYTGRSYLNGQETIIWKVPKVNSMINVSEAYFKIMDGKILNGEETYFENYPSVIGEYDNNFWYVRYGADNDKNIYDEANYGLKPDKETGKLPNPSRNIVYNRLTYQINKYYESDLVNNTIYCFLIKNGVMIRASYSMTFSQHGTAGTDFTFSLGLGKLYDENWNDLDGVDSAITINDYRLDSEGNQINGYREIVFNLYDATNEAIELTDHQKNDIIKLWVRPESTEQIAQGCYQGANSFTKCIDTITQDNGNGEFTRVAIRTASHWVKPGTDEQEGTWVPDESKAVTLEDLRSIVLRASISDIDGVSTQYKNKRYNLKGITFTQLLPLRFKLENKYSLNASEYIIYDQHGGSPKMFNNAIKLEGMEAGEDSVFELCKLESDSTNGLSTLWKGLDLLFNENEVDDYQGLPALTEGNKLIPYPIYITGIEDTPCSLDVYVGEYVDEQDANDGKWKRTIDKNSSMFVYTMPIVILQNEYQVPMFNSWDGNLLIDEENNRIMAATMAAGKKDTENRFTGVVMGDIASQNNESSEVVETVSGLFGYHDGTQSFGFTSEGKGFIGKSGTGRIEFDGTHGWIQSANYTATVANDSSNTFDNEGTKIDLDDGSIDMWGKNWVYSTSEQEWIQDRDTPPTNIHLDTNGTPKNKPYFKIEVPRYITEIEQVSQSNQDEVEVNSTLYKRGLTEEENRQSLIQIDRENFYLQTADYPGEFPIYDGSSDIPSSYTPPAGLKIDLKKGTFDSKGKLTINGARGSRINFGDNNNYLRLGNYASGKSYLEMVSGGGSEEQIRTEAGKLVKYAEDLNGYLWPNQQSAVFKNKEFVNIYGTNKTVEVILPKENIGNYQDYEEALNAYVANKAQNTQNSIIGVINDPNKTSVDYLIEGSRMNPIKIDRQYWNTHELNPERNYYEQVIDTLISYKTDENNEYVLDENDEKIPLETAYRTRYALINYNDLNDYVTNYLTDHDVCTIYLKDYEAWKEPVEIYYDYVTYNTGDKVYVSDNNNNITIYESKVDNNRGQSVLNTDVWESSAQGPLINSEEDQKIFDSYIEALEKTSTSNTAYEKATQEQEEAAAANVEAQSAYTKAQNDVTTATEALNAAQRALDNANGVLNNSKERYDFIVGDSKINRSMTIPQDSGYVGYPYLYSYKNVGKENTPYANYDSLNYMDSLLALLDATAYETAKNTEVNDKKKIFTGNNRSWNKNDTGAIKIDMNNPDTYSENYPNLQFIKHGFSNVFALNNNETNYLRLYNDYKTILSEREALVKEETETRHHFLKKNIDGTPQDIKAFSDETLTESEEYLEDYEYQFNLNHFENNYTVNNGQNLEGTINVIHFTEDDPPEEITTQESIFIPSAYSPADGQASYLIEQQQKVPFSFFDLFISNSKYENDKTATDSLYKEIISQGINGNSYLLDNNNIWRKQSSSIIDVKNSYDNEIAALNASKKTEEEKLPNKEQLFQTWWPENYHLYNNQRTALVNEYNDIMGTISLYNSATEIYNNTNAVKDRLISAINNRNNWFDIKNSLHQKEEVLQENNLSYNNELIDIQEWMTEEEVQIITEYNTALTNYLNYLNGQTEENKNQEINQEFDSAYIAFNQAQDEYKVGFIADENVDSINIYYTEFAVSHEDPYDEINILDGSRIATAKDPITGFSYMRANVQNSDSTHIQEDTVIFKVVVKEGYSIKNTSLVDNPGNIYKIVEIQSPIASGNKIYKISKANDNSSTSGIQHDLRVRIITQIGNQETSQENLIDPFAIEINYGITEQEVNSIVNQLLNDKTSAEETYNSVKARYSYSQDSSLKSKWTSFKDFDDQNIIINKLQNKINTKTSEQNSYLNSDTLVLFNFTVNTNNYGIRNVSVTKDNAVEPVEIPCSEYYVMVKRDILWDDYSKILRLNSGINNDRNALNTRTTHFTKTETVPKKEIDVITIRFEEEFVLNYNKVDRVFHYKLYTKYNNWQDAIKTKNTGTADKNNISTLSNTLKTEKESLESTLFKKITFTSANFVWNNNYYMNTYKEAKYRGADKSFKRKTRLTDHDSFKSGIEYYKVVADFSKEEKARDDANIALGEKQELEKAAKQAADAAFAELQKRNTILATFDTSYIPILLPADYLTNPDIDKNIQYYEILLDENGEIITNSVTGNYTLITDNLNNHINKIIYKNISLRNLREQVLDIISNKIVNMSLETITNKYTDIVQKYVIAYDNFTTFNKGNDNDTIRLNNTSQIRLSIGTNFSVNKEGYLKASAGEMKNITIESLNFKGYVDKNGKSVSGAKGIIPKWMTFVTDVSASIERGYTSVSATVSDTVTVPYSYSYTTQEAQTTRGHIIIWVPGGSTYPTVYSSDSALALDSVHNIWIPGATSGGGAGVELWVNNVATAPRTYTVSKTATTQYNASITGMTDVPIVKSISLTVSKISMWALTNDQAKTTTRTYS